MVAPETISEHKGTIDRPSPGERPCVNHLVSDRFGFRAIGVTVPRDLAIRPMPENRIACHLIVAISRRRQRLRKVSPSVCLFLAIHSSAFFVIHCLIPCVSVCGLRLASISKNIEQLTIRVTSDAIDDDRAVWNHFEPCAVHVCNRRETIFRV